MGVNTDDLRADARRCDAKAKTHGDRGDYQSASIWGKRAVRIRAAADEIERLRARDETLRRYEHLDATQWAYLPVATVAKAEG